MTNAPSVISYYLYTVELFMVIGYDNIDICNT